jgi:hypothetical protein
LEEIREIFTKAGFEEIENKYCYRVIENRKLEKRMYRVWIQARFRKSFNKN